MRSKRDYLLEQRSSSESDHPSAQHLEVSNRVIRVWPQDGRAPTVPIHWVPRLCDGKPDERKLGAV